MLTASIVVGLVGALGMFCGDMLLYFTKGSYEMDGTLHPYTTIMKDISEKRLLIGGILGPVSAFLYVVGFFHICLMVTEEMWWFSLVLWLVLAFTFIVSGAYHSQWTMLGLTSRYGNETMTQKVIDVMGRLVQIYTVPYFLGCIGIAVMIVAGWTDLPLWFVIFSPVVMLFLDFAWLKVPQPYRVVLFGGWYNLVYVIYFFALLIWVLV